MKRFIIITDSCSDLPKKYRDEFNIRYVKNSYSYDGKTFYADLDWSDESPKEFYDIMRFGKRIITSQVNINEYVNAFTEAIKEGYDILSLSVTTALSSSYNTSLKAKEEVLKLYPDSKIVCVDTKRACFGLALICIEAGKLQKEGKNIQEIVKWIEENKQCVHQEGTVDKLIYLKQAGRVSAASAFFGGILNIKPLIIADVNGNNVAVEKVKGRRVSFERIAERISERITDVPYQKMFIGHADCLDEANILKDIIVSKLNNKNIDIEIVYIGQMIGASVGPGMVGIYFWGVPETYNLEEK